MKAQEVGYGHGQRGSNIEEKQIDQNCNIEEKEMDQNSWTREAHKQGEQAHEL